MKIKVRPAMPSKASSDWTKGPKPGSRIGGTPKFNIRPQSPDHGRVVKSAVPRRENLTH